MGNFGNQKLDTSFLCSLDVKKEFLQSREK